MSIDKNTKNRFYIVNECDRPCETLIAEEVNESLYYIHPEHAGYGPMSVLTKTPVEDFGIDLIIIDDNTLQGHLTTRDGTASYTNGRRRSWQGSCVFEFPMPAEPTIKGEKP